MIKSASPTLWDEFEKALEQEIVPALGCTEPVALALASAIAASYLEEEKILSVKALVSPNLYKNGMGVMVPNTGMIGLPVAAACGAIGGDPTAQMQVLQSIRPHHIDEAKILLEQGKVTVEMTETAAALYVNVTLHSKNHSVTVTIQDKHTQVTSITKNGEALPLTSANKTETANHTGYDLSNATVLTVFNFATEAPFKKIEPILKAGIINDALADEGLKNRYGMSIAHALQTQVDQGLLANDMLSQIMIRAAAASDARMGGAALPAMSNSGSGNQGIAATLPVLVVAEFTNTSQELTARALLLSHLAAIYIHSTFPKLSALCAVTTAGMGAAAGIAYLLGKQNYEIVSMAINNMIGDVAGMICDGASNSCALKVSTAASMAFKSALLALSHTQASHQDGIVCTDVDESIRNLGALASQSMKGTDEQIIQIMINKPAHTYTS